MNHSFLRLAPLLAALALGSLAGCGTSSVVNEAEQPEPVADAAADMPADDAAAAPDDAGSAGDAGPAGTDGATDGKRTPPLVQVGGGDAGAKGSKADGATCDGPDECASGVCEGEGCGPGQGTCAAKNRMCTRDLRPYCGCDGKTFQSSGSCPGARFSKKAACDGDPGGARLPPKG